MDNDEMIRKKIKKAKTADVLMPETEKEINDLPEVNNLLNIFSGVTKKSKIELINTYSGKNFSGFKENLSEALVELISPINSEISRLMSDKKYLDSIIKKGSEKANERATKTLKEVYDIIGFVKR
jgi:tryptophanyl-tRNA synthetase